MIFIVNPYNEDDISTKECHFTCDCYQPREENVCNGKGVEASDLLIFGLLT